MKRRVMLKLSGEALSGDSGFGFDYDICDNYVKQIKKSVDNGVEVAIMVGGGNFIRGRSLVNIDKYRADEIGMLSTCMNTIFLTEVLRKNNIKASMYGAFPYMDAIKLFSKYDAINDLENGKVIVIAGGTGHPYFTTDTGVVLRCLQLECDELLLAKSIDGIYDKDPKKYNDAKKYDEITFEEMIEKKLLAIDLEGSIMGYENNLKAQVFALNEDNSIMKVMNGERIGTIIKSK